MRFIVALLRRPAPRGGRGGCRGSRSPPCAGARRSRPRPAPRGRADAPASTGRISPIVAAGPLVIITMRSDSSTASSTSCVTITTVLFVRATIFSSSSCRCARVSASSAPKGSSISSTLGSIASARAMPTRCFMPPEISCGRLVSAWPMPTSSSAARVRSFKRALLSRPPKTRSTASMHVVEAGQPGQQRVILEHHRTLRPRCGDLAVVAQQHAAGGQQQPGDQVQQRTLAAARVADQRDELAWRDGEVESRAARGSCPCAWRTPSRRLALR